MISRHLRVAAIVVLAVGAGACSSSQPSQSSMEPTETPSPPVTPADISSQWRTVNGENFTIGVPESYKEEVVTASNGTEAYVFDAPGSDEDGTLERVAVMRDEQPETDVIEQSLVLEEMQSVENEEPVHRTEVSWPGAEQAVLVQWTNPVGDADGDRRQTWQLMVQISPDLILNVVALAPPETFMETDLPEILATFKGR